MITPSFGVTATERVLPRLALDFTTASLDPRITFTRTTDALNPATYINSFGIITAATNDQPRFDYDPVTLVCKGLLIEESRTNLLLNSLIDGTVLNTQIVAVTAVSTTLSFYGTGTVTLSGAHSASVVGTGAYPTRTTYSFTPTASALTLTVTGTVQYAQLEVGTFATSYIPTTSAALTRNADVAVMTGTNFSDWFNASEGTFEVQSTVGVSGAAVLSVNDGSTNNFITFSANGSFGGAARTFSIRTATVYQTTFNVATVSTQTVTQWCGAYKQNNCANSVNAVATVTDALVSLPTVNQLFIGGLTSPGLNGHMMKIMYWSQRLTNNEVRAFSKG